MRLPIFFYSWELEPLYFEKSLDDSVIVWREQSAIDKTLGGGVPYISILMWVGGDIAQKSRIYKFGKCPHNNLYKVLL